MTKYLSIPQIIASLCEVNRIDELIIEPADPYASGRYSGIYWQVRSPDGAIPLDLETKLIKWAQKHIDDECRIFIHDKSAWYAGDERILIIETPAD